MGALFIFPTNRLVKIHGGGEIEVFKSKIGELVNHDDGKKSDGKS